MLLRIPLKPFLAGLVKTTEPVRRQVKPRVRVLLALLEGRRGRVGEVADGQDVEPGHQGVVEQVRGATVEAKDAEEDLEPNVGGDGAAYVFACVEEAEGAGEGDFACYVVGDVGEEGGEVEGGVGRSVAGRRKKATRGPVSTVKTRIKEQNLRIHPVKQLAYQPVDGILILHHIVHEKAGIREVLHQVDLVLGVPHGDGSWEAPVGKRKNRVPWPLESGSCE